MKKIRLNLDNLTIESFPTAEAAGEKGTVDANMASRVGDTWCITCGEYTCWDHTCEPEYC